MPTVRVSTPEGWAVLDHRGVPIASVTAFLRHLHRIERSPNTIRSYAYDLGHFFAFLNAYGYSWTAVTNETLAEFIRDLRSPTSPIASRPASERRSEATVNRALAAVTSFALYLYDATNDTVHERLSRSAVRTNRWLEDSRASRARVGPRMRAASTQHRVLEGGERAAIIGACPTLRDRFLFSLLDETGMRAGQALLLRHSDISVPSSSIRVQRHDGAGSRERNKSLPPATVPVSPQLIRLYAAYMHTEYRLLDSDYVFVTLSGPTLGEPMTYKNLDRLVRRLRRVTGIQGWSAHSFRHTYVTRLLAAGVPMETVSYLVTHSSVLTTVNTYNHPNPVQVREQLTAAGVWGDE